MSLRVKVKGQRWGLTKSKINYFELLIKEGDQMSSSQRVKSNFISQRSHVKVSDSNPYSGVKL